MQNEPHVCRTPVDTSNDWRDGVDKEIQNILGHCGLIKDAKKIAIGRSGLWHNLWPLLVKDPEWTKRVASLAICPSIIEVQDNEIFDTGAELFGLGDKFSGLRPLEESDCTPEVLANVWRGIMTVIHEYMPHLTVLSFFIYEDYNWLRGNEFEMFRVILQKQTLVFLDLRVHGIQGRATHKIDWKLPKLTCLRLELELELEDNSMRDLFRDVIATCKSLMVLNVTENLVWPQWHLPKLRMLTINKDTRPVSSDMEEDARYSIRCLLAASTNDLVELELFGYDDEPRLNLDPAEIAARQTTSPSGLLLPHLRVLRCPDSWLQSLNKWRMCRCSWEVKVLGLHAGGEDEDEDEVARTIALCRQYPAFKYRPAEDKA